MRHEVDEEMLAMGRGRRGCFPGPRMEGSSKEEDPRVALTYRGFKGTYCCSVCLKASTAAS